MEFVSKDSEPFQAQVADHNALDQVPSSLLSSEDLINLRPFPSPMKHLPSRASTESPR